MAVSKKIKSKARTELTARKLKKTVSSDNTRVHNKFTLPNTNAPKKEKTMGARLIPITPKLKKKAVKKRRSV